MTPACVCVSGNDDDTKVEKGGRRVKADCAEEGDSSGAEAYW